MSSYLSQAASRSTPQSQPILGSGQVKNHAGGYAWEVDDWQKLDRFLILGSEGGTYYATQRDLTRMHSEAALALLQEDGVRLVQRVVEVSTKGLAPKNDPALFVLALASAKGNPDTRAAAFAALPKVARTSTHLFDFLNFRQAFGGWGRGLRRAVSDWYLQKDPKTLAHQLVKYRQRNGWTHRDVLRKAHPKALDPAGSALFRYAAKGADRVEGVTGIPEGSSALPAPLYPHPLVQGFEMAQRSPSAQVTAGLIREFGLPREALLTEHLGSPAVWAALLDQGMPITAMVRNLGNMSKVGLLRPMSEAAGIVVAALSNEEAIRKSRIHPVQILTALLTYRQGAGVRGSGSWTPVSHVVDALDRAFYLSFKNVEPSGKRVVLGLDVSGSMNGTRVNGLPNLTAREACGAMALITAATEPMHAFVAFDTAGGYWGGDKGKSGYYPLSISPRQRLDSVVEVLANTGGGGTDCTLPIQYALDHGLEVDAFVIYTDSETWAGRQHPAEAIQEYRRKTGVQAKLVVVALASTGHSIADPKDAGMLNVVGFDTSAPDLISRFIAG